MAFLKSQFRTILFFLISDDDDDVDLADGLFALRADFCGAICFDLGLTMLSLIPGIVFESGAASSVFVATAVWQMDQMI